LQFNRSISKKALIGEERPTDFEIRTGFQMLLPGALPAFLIDPAGAKDSVGKRKPTGFEIRTDFRESGQHFLSIILLRIV
jgi:hypothetical protein